MNNLGVLPNAGHSDSHFMHTSFCVRTVPRASSTGVTMPDILDIVHGISIPFKVAAPSGPCVSSAH